MQRAAAALLALLTLAGPTQALTVSRQAGDLIKEAKTLANAGNYKAALAKLDAAEAVKSYEDDETVINAMRQSITAKTSPSSQP